jgi:hypothetical protein
VSVTRGKVNDYLGMTLDFTEPGKVKFTMDDHVENLLAESPADMSGTAATPAANYLFTVNNKAMKLDKDKAEEFHHLTAKMLDLCTRARPDIRTAVAFQVLA